MLSDTERLKLLRKELNIKQGDFAEKISTTQGHISDIENGRKNLSERTIKLICLEDWDGKTVNEEWLRTGEGEMFVQRTEEEEIADLVYDLLDPKDNDFYIAVLELLHTYKDLTPSSQKIIKEFASEFMKNCKKEKET